uniref:Uncharacterized protein n=2 Tax=Oryza sativa subsp. japonica TaxID=39947 RepID=Q53LX7_ORYSJ|nr:hypothetical protein LOC_Os11g16620 [Oryza sativa Japonica Group]ABA92594.1 hypothetical protein LOC_Os11g16619 [Oryza sativa Japonica Group]
MAAGRRLQEARRRVAGGWVGSEFMMYLEITDLGILR